MRTPGAIRLVHRRVPHHASHSGYDRISDYLLGRRTSIVGPEATGWVRHVGGLAARLAPNRWYDANCFAAEVSVITSPARVTHFLYADDQVWLTSRVRGRDGARIATYHQPPEIFDSVAGTSSARALDIVIAVASNQLDRLTALVRGDVERVRLIPLGVDTDFFSPAASVPTARPFLCLAVGFWLRRFDLLRAVADEVTRRHGREVEFRLVCSPPPDFEFGPAMRVESSLSDLQLRETYRSASLMIHPVSNATANCAVLEAMACGVPVIASDVGGVRDYVSDRDGALVRNDVEPFVEAIETFLHNVDLRSIAGRHARTRAEEFAWPIVARRLSSTYAEVS